MHELVGGDFGDHVRKRIFVARVGEMDTILPPMSCTELARTVIWMMLIAGLAACGMDKPGTHVGGKNATDPRTWVFICPDESSYVVRATENEAWVFRAGASLRLTAVSGRTLLRYEHGDVQLVIDEGNGVLSEPGKETVTCRNDRRQAIWEHAKLDGVDFRGVGNEPPWVLEIRDMSRIVLMTDYGDARIERPLPEAVTDQGRKMTQWDAGDLQIEITAEMCHDTMSGESFDSRVVIHWEGQVLRGCGRPLH